MARISVVLGLTAALAMAIWTRPVDAASPTVQRAVLGQTGCAGVVLSVDFQQGVYCEAGRQFSNFLSMPGAGFTRASPKTCVDGIGDVIAAAAGVPCITDQGILIEESRTNLSTYSGDATNVTWDVTAGTKTTGQADPLGGSGAALYTADGTNAIHVYRNTGNNFAIPIASGVTYSISYFVKPGSASRIQLTGNNVPFGTAQYANFLLVGPGSISASSGMTGAGATITALARGWYRVTITLTATATGVSDAGLLIPLVTGAEVRAPTNTSAGTFTAYGSQIEASSFASSFIATNSSAGTRAADLATIGGLKALPNYTLFAEGSRVTSAFFGAHASLNDGTTNNETYVISTDPSHSGTWSEGYVVNAGTAVGGFIGNGAVNTDVKMALSVSPGAFSGSASGAAPTSYVPTGPTAYTTLTLGARGGGQNQIDGWLRRAALYSGLLPTRALTQ